jgi:hypothetical protein
LDHFLDHAPVPVVASRVQHRARSRLLVGGLSLLSACAPAARQTIVVAPRPVTRTDSASLAGFSIDVIALMKQVAKDESLDGFGRNVGPGKWQACFGYTSFWSGFTFCGRMLDSVMKISFFETGLGQSRAFDERAERIRRQVIESLRGKFGESRVRECGRRPEDCPRLVQIDSGG